MIGKRLKELRGKRTQQEVADLVGVSRASYSHYENDHVQPDNETLTKLSALYKVSSDEILGIKKKGDSIEETKEGYSLETIDKAIFDEFMKLDPRRKDKLRRIMEIVKEE